MEAFNNLSEKDRLFYTKVVTGSIVGISSGLINGFTDQVPNFTLFLIAIGGIIVIGQLARPVLGITEMDSSRIYFTGTFTYFLFFILTWVIVVMLFFSENLVPPNSLM